MNPQMMMGGQPPMPGQPPAGGQGGLLAAALMGQQGGMDTLGGDGLQQVIIDFPLQPPAPPLDDGMLDGGFPALNMGGGMGMMGGQQGMGLDPNMLAMLLQGQQGQGMQQPPPQAPPMPQQGGMQPPAGGPPPGFGQPPGRPPM